MLRKFTLDVFTKGYISSSRDASELSNRLDKVLKCLQGMDQDARHPGLENIAACLLEKNVLGTQVSRVRIQHYALC